MSKEWPHFRHVGGSQSTVTQFPGRCQAGRGAEGIKGMLVALSTLVFSLITYWKPVLPSSLPPLLLDLCDIEPGKAVRDCVWQESLGYAGPP